MEMLADVEQACRDNNHESVKRGLDRIESHDLKRKAFLKIIEYYENEEKFKQKHKVDVVSEFYGERVFMGKLLYREMAFSSASITNLEKGWIIVISESYNDEQVDNLPKECKF